MPARRSAMIHYTVRPGHGEPNEALVRDVYAELERARPAGLRYATFKRDNGLTFTHVAWSEADPSPLLALDASRAFEAGIRDRCAEPPVVTELDEIGSFAWRASPNTRRTL
jgi:hypothetical protein